MPNETGKERQSRIQQDYFARDPMVRWRSWLALAAMFAALGWWILAPIWDSDHEPRVKFLQGDRLASPGFLTRAHAPWESKCTACHVRFEPINGSEWSPLGWVAHRDTAQSGNANCQQCHSGPAHHQTEIKAEVPACAQCHRDHRGRDARLARTEDATCTQCHANLIGHRLKDSGVAPTVTRFDQDLTHHPEIVVIAKQKKGEGGDPGKLKFNHSLHMARGLSSQKDGKSLPIMTYAQLLESDLFKNGWSSGQRLDSPVQLECATCHQLDGEESRRSSRASSTNGLPQLSAGMYMLPITYEKDCRACHPLQFERGSPSREVRHGRTPAQVLAEVRQFYAAEALKDNPDLLRRALPRRAMPGKEAEVNVDARLVRQAVDEKVQEAVRILFGSGQKGCIECHELTPTPLKLGRTPDLDNAKITPVMVPQIWLKHAVFDHSAHRAVQCLQCHDQAMSSQHNSDLLLPDIESCTKCHGPAEVKGGTARGGAGSDCTECHKYHNGDRPLEGKGSSAWGVADKQTIQDFLKGKTQ